MDQGHYYPHSFFLWFFRQVCFYAYGPALRQRCAIMEGYPNRRSHDRPSCLVCGEPWKFNVCKYCGNGANRKKKRKTLMNLPFFVKIARYLLVLRLARDQTMLWECMVRKRRPEGAQQCYGCDTWITSSKLDYNICYGDDNAHPMGTVVYCGADWCRPETKGWLHCPICAIEYCGDCISICYVCAMPGACSSCRRYFECDDAKNYGEEYSAPKCTPRCLAHAVPRMPRPTVVDRESFVEFLCATHVAAYDEVDTIHASCATCNQTLHEKCDCQGGTRDCWNPVCMHTDVYAAGDLRCVPCQGIKRIKLE